MVEEVKAALNENPNITAEVKDDLMYLITIFCNNFKDVNLDNLKERLKTLKISRGSMYLVKLPCQYNPHNNEIAINLGRFEGSDAKHWMMHALLGVITAKDNYYGFNNEDGTLQALNEGYTEILTNYLVGDVEDSFYTDEVIMTNLISEVIGNDVMYKAYFTNDANLLLNAMSQAEGK